MASQWSQNASLEKNAASIPLKMADSEGSVIIDASVRYYTFSASLCSHKTLASVYLTVKI
jgi:hypothetical protein